MDNAALAIAALRASGLVVSDEAIAQGLQSVVWPGRMQNLPKGALTEVSQARTIWLDGGHNPHAAKAQAQVLGEASADDTVLICAMLNTKDQRGYFAALSKAVSRVITIPITSSDAGVDPHDLRQTASSAGLRATTAANLREALEMAGGAERILIGGSLYLVGDALAQNGTPPV